MPRRIVQAQAAAGRDCFIIAFDGQTDAETVVGVAHIWVKFGDAGTVIASMKAAGVMQVHAMFWS